MVGSAWLGQVTHKKYSDVHHDRIYKIGNTHTYIYIHHHIITYHPSASTISISTISTISTTWRAPACRSCSKALFTSWEYLSDGSWTSVETECKRMQGNNVYIYILCIHSTYIHWYANSKAMGSANICANSPRMVTFFVTTITLPRNRRPGQS